MPRWLRVIRGMIGTGLTFAVGVGAVGSLIGLGAMIFGRASLDDLRIIGRLSVVAFILGVAFSGGLALVARTRTFEKLSLRFVTGLGAAGGLLYFLFIAAANGARVWSPGVALWNLMLLLVMGAGSAAAMFVIARKARATLAPGVDSASLGEGAPDATAARQGSGQKERA